MTSQDMVRKLMDYYNGGKYSTERISELDRFCDVISDNDREAVYESITDTRGANTPIAKSDIREACARMGVSCRVMQYIPDQKVECDCCGESFKFNHAPSDEQQITFNIHAHCPNCGFQYAWTIQARDTQEVGKETDWYDEYLDKFQKNGYGRDKQRGPWFQSAKEIKAIEDDKRETLQAKVEAIRNKIKVEK